MLVSGVRTGILKLGAPGGVTTTLLTLKGRPHHWAWVEINIFNLLEPSYCFVAPEQDQSSPASQAPVTRSGIQESLSPPGNTSQDQKKHNHEDRALSEINEAHNRGPRFNLPNTKLRL
jgi:hypothetical protein